MIDHCHTSMVRLRWSRSARREQAERASGQLQLLNTVLFLPTCPFIHSRPRILRHWLWRHTENRARRHIMSQSNTFRLDVMSGFWLVCDVIKPWRIAVRWLRCKTSGVMASLGVLLAVAIRKYITKNTALLKLIMIPSISEQCPWFF